MNAVTSRLETALEAHGAQIPDWVRELASYVDTVGLKKAAQRIGYSQAVLHEVIRKRAQRWPWLQQRLAQRVAIGVSRPGQVGAAQGVQQRRKLPGGRAPPARPNGIARQGNAAGAALKGRQAPEAGLPRIAHRGDPVDTLILFHPEKNAKARRTTQLDGLDA